MVADCTGFIEPLNLECWLVNTLAGTTQIFVFFAFIFLAGLAAYFRMLSTTFLLMFILFTIVMSQFVEGMLFLAILLAGLVGTIILSRMLK